MCVKPWKLSFLDMFQNASPSKKTAMAWSLDYSYLAVGSDDGLVLVNDE